MSGEKCHSTHSVLGPKKGLAEAFKDFDLKSEYFEKNVRLKKIETQNSEAPIHTQVKVYKAQGEVETIRPSELKEIIKKTRGIKQVVVEKVSVKEASRVSMLFEPKRKEDKTNHFNLLEESGEEKPLASEEVAKRSYSLEEVEKLINAPFLDVEEDVISSFDQASEEASVLKFNGIEEQVADDQEKREPIAPKSKVLSLKMKGTPSKEDIGVENEKVDHEVAYLKETLTRKNKRAHSGYYYRAKDHVELFKVGSSYMKDFKNGIKSFAFSSFKLKDKRERSVFGISTYFNYHADINIVIVTENFDKSFYQEFIGETKKQDIDVFDEDFTYEVHVANGLEIIELSELRKVERKLKLHDFEAFLGSVSERYDVLLWDLPDIEILDANKEIYFPIIRTLENVSLIVRENKTRVKSINKIIDYFRRYQVPVKGLLLSQFRPKKRGQK